jgi:hypothetical protein
LIRIRRSLFRRPLVRLGLRLLRGFGRLVSFALAAFEVVICFAWYVGRSGFRVTGQSNSLDPKPFVDRLH